MATKKAVKKPAAKKAAKTTKKAAAKRAAKPAKVQAEVVQPSADGPTLARTVSEDQPRKKPVQYQRDEVHPDVTSLGGPKAVLGNGIAKHEDLAPGQSLEPSPPASSSNILPQEENPSFG